MIEKLTKVYYCEHCKKKGFYRASIKKHEQTCFGNPDNVPACMKRIEDFPGSGCLHLKQVDRHYFCSLKQITMHTKYAEVRGYPLEKTSEIMPKYCLAYESNVKSEVPF